MVFFILAKLHHRHRIFLPHPLLMRSSFRSYSFFAATGKYFPTSISCHTPNYSTTAPSLGAAIINEERLAPCSRIPSLLSAFPPALTMFVAAAEVGLLLGEEQATTSAGGREVTSLTPFQLIPSHLTQPVAAPRKTKGEYKKTLGLVVDVKCGQYAKDPRRARRTPSRAEAGCTCVPDGVGLLLSAVLPIRTVRRDGSAAEGDPGRKGEMDGGGRRRAEKARTRRRRTMLLCVYTAARRWDGGGGGGGRWRARSYGL
ncbi:hypothetical protein B0H14DRAFT_3139139 [Mycena olivaceomarginata]|nr:hypothetical protein B0H14DRAFT_3139139 [Mycena olivaceomarginata]